MFSQPIDVLTGQTAGQLEELVTVEQRCYRGVEAGGGGGAERNNMKTDTQAQTLC